MSEICEKLLYDIYFGQFYSTYKTVFVLVKSRKFAN